MSVVPQNVIFPQGNILSDEPPLETDLHLDQIIILLGCLKLLWENRNDFYAGGNLTIYYSKRQRKDEKFRGPDFFVVLNTERKSRDSWVVWQENYKYPNLIVELLSASTAKIDKKTKKDIYQDIFKTPDYFWFDPKSLEFAGFHLVNGVYQPIPPNSQGWLWSQQLNLYLGVYQRKLRFFKPDGELVPTEKENSDQQTFRAEQEAQRANEEAQRAEQEAQRANEETQRANEEAQRANEEAQRANEEALKAQQEKQRAERAIAKLRELGIDSDNI